MRLVLLGDAQSPHLLKWARALAPRVDLWVASSRGFAEGFDGLLDPARRLALNTHPAFAGGNVAVLRTLPRLARWLAQVKPDWINAHYLTSHGTLAWLATTGLGAPGRIVGSAWGSDILQTPARSLSARLLTRRVLAACALTTSDSMHMAERMRALGAREVMTFPFGLEQMPELPKPQDKLPQLFFSNRALEPIYAPMRVIDTFAAVAAEWPEARLAMANDGSLRDNVRAQIDACGLQDRIELLGRLDAQTQSTWYARARWFISVPVSDSMSVSVLEAMAQGCIPLLSDLPANRELVRDRENGLILPAAHLLNALDGLMGQADGIASDNHEWIREYALFPQAIDRFLARLQALN